jgi:hypothetical protein
VQPFVGLYAIGAGNSDEPLDLTLFVDACAISGGAVNTSMCGAAGTGFRNLPIYAVGGGFDEDDKDLKPTAPFTFQIGDACKPPTPPPSVPSRPPSHAPSPAPRTPTQQPTDAKQKSVKGLPILAVVLGSFFMGLVVPMLAFRRMRGKANNPDNQGSGMGLLSDLDEVLIGGNAADKIANEYNAVVVNGMQSVLWAKLMFIGQGRAGKTSLLKNLTKQQFNADEMITDGADVCIVNNKTWDKTEKMEGSNFTKGVAELVGAGA